MPPQLYGMFDLFKKNYARPYSLFFYKAGLFKLYFILPAPHKFQRTQMSDLRLIPGSHGCISAAFYKMNLKVEKKM
jgi:hypothetical protein